MKKPLANDRGRAQHSGRAARGILAENPAGTCPTAPECRRRWLVNEHNQITCGFCYQVLERPALAAILAGA